MQLHIIRHGQSVNNAYGDDPHFQHIEDAPLTPLGHQQAAHLAGAIRRQMEDNELQAMLDGTSYLPVYRIDELLSSPFQRALQTVKPIADVLQKPVQIMMDAYEYGGIYRREGSPGNYRYVGKRGLNRAQMQAIVPNLLIPELITDTGWWHGDFEPDIDFLMRTERAAAYLHEQANGPWADRSVAIVSHADFANMLIQTLLLRNTSMEAYRKNYIYMYNTSVTRIDFTPWGQTILRYTSRIDHLPIEMVTL